MIEQLVRSIEMVLTKQLKLITGNDPIVSTHRADGHGLGPKMEVHVGVTDNSHKERQFKIILEEIE